MSYPALKTKKVRDNVVRIFHPETVEPGSYLTASVAAAGVTLTLKSNLGFSNTDPQDLVLFEGFGNEAAEIKRVNGAVTAGTSLTVQALTFAHGIDTPVLKVLFNQYELSGASTATGSKTVIATTDINVNGPWTDAIVTGTTYAFYFVRGYNSLATTPYFGAYSDAIAAAGFDPKNVGFIREQAFGAMGEAIGKQFTNDWVYDQVYLGELEVSKRLKRWSWLSSYDYDLGNVTTGMASIALPSDIEDSDTQKSILGLRIGNGVNMTYLDRPEFEQLMQGVATTTLASTAAIGATSFTLTDSRDFGDSGSVIIAGTTYSYTTNTRATNVLSGITAIAAEITSGTQVWQNIGFSEPTRYTVKDGSAYFENPPSSDFSGRNIWLDYYKSPTRVDSDGDSISVNDPKVIISYLKMKIAEKKAKGSLSPTDNSILEFERGVTKLIENEISGVKLHLVPQGADLSGRGSSVRNWRR